ncbi:MAG TPA: F0F1 ATP synthase subunit B [Acetobacteraceae bacterium]|nr:F0F1 ATP synthase subunit B [Acetobacteraceae bacterium]
MEHHHESFFADPRTWVAIAFVIFFVIFGRKAWAAITAMLDKRAVQIQAELDEASRLRREAEAMLQQANAQREQALKDAQAMLEHARAEAAQVAEAAREEAAAAAERRERMAMDRIGAAEKAAVTEVRLAAADIAARAAEQVIAHGFGAEADAGLVDRAIQGLPSALAGRRAA